MSHRVQLFDELLYLLLLVSQRVVDWRCLGALVFAFLFVFSTMLVQVVFLRTPEGSVLWGFLNFTLVVLLGGA